MRMKKIIFVLLALAVLFTSVACVSKKTGTDTTDTNNSGEGTQTTSDDDIKLPDVVKGSMTFKDLGVVTFEIYPNKARQSCLNFIYLVNKGHYNGVIVDRIVKDLLIQAGDYQSGFVPRNTEFDYGIKGEFEKNGVENNLGFVNGAMAWMYNGEDYDSAHTSFAIFPDASTSWDMKGSYAVFGIVTGEDSFKVLNKINKRKTYQEKPSKEIMITSVTLDPIDQEGFDPTFEFPEPNFIMKGTADTSETKKE